MSNRLRMVPNSAYNAVGFTAQHVLALSKGFLIVLSVRSFAHIAACCALLSAALPARAVDVLTQHNDNYRSGANTHERVLNTSNVNVNTFGKLFSRDVDGCVYAQPLVATGVKIDRHRRDVVYVATEHNTVYAFDAVDPNASTPLWQVNLGLSVSTHDYDSGPYGEYHDFSKEVGITGTPVIDRSTQTLYVVAKTKEAGLYHLWLHALDMSTGHDRPHSPVEVTATMAAKGDGSKDGVLTVDPWKQMNRPGLLLANGVVYVALVSLEDYSPYHGWVIGYDVATLKQTAVFNDTADGVAGGIWQSGNGPCVDADGDIWVTTGNGTFDAAMDGHNYGDSFVRLDPRKGRSVVDWMTPHDQQAMDASDADLGSGGPVYVPGANVIVGGGKDCFLFVLDPHNAGHFRPDRDASMQSFRVADAHVHGAPVYWSGQTGLHLYVWPEQPHLLSFKVDGAHVGETPEAKSEVRAPDGMPGGFLSVSSDGSKAGTGIVWAMHSY